jgi:uncharacterized protein
MIEVKIESIRISVMNQTNMVIILKELEGERCIPIFVGRPDGEWIYFRLNHMEAQRPMSHDLAVTILESLDAKVNHVLVRELHSKQYFASIFFGGDNGQLEIDSRPSDALAIAVRTSCPIYVSEAVMNAVGILPPDAANARGAESDIGAFSDFIGSLDLGDLDEDDDKNKDK